MGSVVFAAIGFVPLYLLSNMLIVRYRQHLLAWVRNSKWMTAVKATKLYEAYERLSSWGVTA